MTLPEVGAVLWDMDGTLLDTIPLHIHAWTVALERESKPVSLDEMLATFGKPSRVMARTLLGEDASESDIARLIEAKGTAYHARMTELGVQFCPGALTWLQRFQQAGWKQAIVSSAGRRSVNSYLAHIPLMDYLQAIVTVDDVQRGKPDPEPFLLAAQRLVMAPHHCLVIGDADADIAGGRAAGMSTIAIRATTPELIGDLTVDTLEDLTEADLLTLLGKA